jgi:hypothetical protein
MWIASRVYLVGVLAIIASGPIAKPSSGAAPTPALADAATERSPAADPTDEPHIILLKPDGLETVLGREVKTAAEHDVGRIIDVLADRDGGVRAVVIEFGGFLGIGTRKIAVEWSALHYDATGGRAFWLVDVNRDQLRAAPEYKASAPAVVPRASN